MKLQTSRRLTALLFLEPLRWTGVGGQHHASAALILGRTSDTHCKKGCVGSGTCEENFASTGTRSRTVRHIVSRYTDYAISTHCK